MNDARAARARAIAKRLHKAYPDAGCTLGFRSPLELLVATVLSAQCTDERVNLVTKSLFKKYRKPEDYLRVPVATLENRVTTAPNPMATKP
jgi:endonuclease-3